MNITLVIIFCHGFVRTPEDDDECNARNHLLYKGTRLKKEAKKKKGRCTFTCHRCIGCLLEQCILQQRFNNIIYNNVSAMSFVTLSSAALFQPHFCSTVFVTSNFALTFFALRCCNNIKLLCCNNIWFLITLQFLCSNTKLQQ